jgi:hypothetical protein
MNKNIATTQAATTPSNAAGSAVPHAKRERLARARAIIAAQFGASVLVSPEGAVAAHARSNPT